MGRLGAAAAKLLKRGSPSPKRSPQLAATQAAPAHHPTTSQTTASVPQNQPLPASSTQSCSDSDDVFLEASTDLPLDGRHADTDASDSAQEVTSSMTSSIHVSPLKAEHSAAAKSFTSPLHAHVSSSPSPAGVAASAHRDTDNSSVGLVSPEPADESQPSTTRYLGLDWAAGSPAGSGNYGGSNVNSSNHNGAGVGNTPQEKNLSATSGSPTTGKGVIVAGEEATASVAPPGASALPEGSAAAAAAAEGLPACSPSPRLPPYRRSPMNTPSRRTPRVTSCSITGGADAAAAATASPAAGVSAALASTSHNASSSGIEDSAQAHSARRTEGDAVSTGNRTSEQADATRVAGVATPVRKSSPFRTPKTGQRGGRSSGGGEGGDREAGSASRGSASASFSRAMRLIDLLSRAQEGGGGEKQERDGDGEGEGSSAAGASADPSVASFGSVLSASAASVVSGGRGKEASEGSSVEGSFASCASSAVSHNSGGKAASSSSGSVTGSGSVSGGMDGGEGDSSSGGNSAPVAAAAAASDAADVEVRKGEESARRRMMWDEQAESGGGTPEKKAEEGERGSESVEKEGRKSARRSSPLSRLLGSPFNIFRVSIVGRVKIPLRAPVE